MPKNSAEFIGMPHSELIALIMPFVLILLIYVIQQNCLSITINSQTFPGILTIGPLSIIFIFLIAYYLLVNIVMIFRIRIGGRHVQSFLEATKNFSPLYAFVFSVFFIIIGVQIIFRGEQVPAVLMLLQGLSYILIGVAIPKLAFDYSKKINESIRNQCLAESSKIEDENDIEKLLKDVYWFISYNFNRDLPFAGIERKNSDYLKNYSYHSTVEKEAVIKNVKSYVERMVNNFENLKSYELVISQDKELSYDKLITKGFWAIAYEKFCERCVKYEQWILVLVLIATLWVLQTRFGIDLLNPFLAIFNK